MARDIVKVIFSISQKVLSITDEEFEELQSMIDGQREYNNPLKCDTTSKQHRLAEHNQRMVDLLKALQSELKNTDDDLK